MLHLGTRVAEGRHTLLEAQERGQDFYFYSLYLERIGRASERRRCESVNDGQRGEGVQVCGKSNVAAFVGRVWPCLGVCLGMSDECSCRCRVLVGTASRPRTQALSGALCRRAGRVSRAKSAVSRGPIYMRGPFCHSLYAIVITIVLL